MNDGWFPTSIQLRYVHFVRSTHIRMLNCIYHLQLVLNELYSVHSNLRLIGDKCIELEWLRRSFVVCVECVDLSMFPLIYQPLSIFVCCCGCRIICLYDLHRLQKFPSNSYNPTDTKFNVFFFFFRFFFSPIHDCCSLTLISLIIAPIATMCVYAAAIISSMLV